MNPVPPPTDSEIREDLSNDVLNQFDDWVWRATPKGVFTYLSPSVEKMTGFAPEELLNKPITEVLEKLFPEEGQQAVIRSLQNRESGSFGNEVIAYDLVYKRKDGSEFIGEMRSSPVVNSNGERIAIQGITRDVTEHRAMLNEIKKSNELFSAFFAMSSNPCVITDRLTGKIVDANPACVSLFGWSHDELLGKTPFELDLFDEDSKPKANQNRKSISLGTAPAKIQIAMRTKSGEERSCLVESALVEISGALRAFTTITDVTNQEKIERELIKIAKLESIGIFAGGIAHDLNNLLTAILGNINMAQLVQDQDEVAKHLADAESATINVQKIAQQLLTFSKGGNPALELLHIEQLIRNSVFFLLHDSDTLATIDIPNDLWQVKADKTQMGQVISNLVINAKQASPSNGTIFITARNKQVNTTSGLPITSGAYVQVTVKDKGTGIPEKALQKIFDPFYSTKHEGSGLGLSSCYSILNKHNGCITVTSELGKGASFDFYLPAAISTIL